MIDRLVWVCIVSGHCDVLMFYSISYGCGFGGLCYWIYVVFGIRDNLLVLGLVGAEFVTSDGVIVRFVNCYYILILLIGCL